jgi:uncharacterized repeat protein (TIGR03943 family)
MNTGTAMSTTINQIIFSLATITWGAVPVYLYASGHIVKYLSPAFHVISLSGGLAMIVLGLFNLLNARRQVGCGHDHSHEHGDAKQTDHDPHAQSPLAAICLMVLPVLLCSGFTKHEYSEKALAWKGLYKQRSARSSLFSAKREPFTREKLERTTSKTKDGHYLLTITELFWSAGDEEIMKAYEGLPAELEGRLIDEDSKLNPGGNRKRLYRIFMTCCAADAQVLGMALEFDGPFPDLANKTWIKVGGTVAYEKVEGQDFAYLKVTRLEATAEPPESNPFGPRF